MPRWRVTNAKSRFTPRSASFLTSPLRIARIRSRMLANSLSHSARSSGVDSTVATTEPPCVGGLE